MASIFRSTELVLHGDLLFKATGCDGTWSSHAMFDVANSEEFSLEVQPVGDSSWEDETILIGIVPKDADLNQSDIENKVGMFVYLGWCPEGPEVMMPNRANMTFAMKDWGRCASPDAAESSAPPFWRMRMDYVCNELYLSFGANGRERVPVADAIPSGDYRPCVSFPELKTRLSVSVDVPSRKRKKVTDEAPAEKIVKNLWAARDFTDASVAVGTSIIPVHRCVLAAASPFFERAFKSSMRESSAAKVVIDDAEPAVIEALLSFLYTGLIDHVADDYAAMLLPIAHRFEVPELVDHCGDRLVKDLNEHNVVCTVSVLRAYRDGPYVKPHWDRIVNLVQSDARLTRALMLGDSVPAASV